MVFLRLLGIFIGLGISNYLFAFYNASTTIVQDAGMITFFQGVVLLIVYVVLWDKFE